MSAFSTAEILHNVVQHANAGKSYRTLCQLCIEAELNVRLFLYGGRRNCLIPLFAIVFDVR